MSSEYASPARTETSLIFPATRFRFPTFRLREAKNFAVVGCRQSMHRKPGLANQRNLFQSWIRFNLLERHRLAQRFDRRKIDRAPIAFLRSRIGIGGPNNFCDPNYSFA